MGIFKKKQYGVINVSPTDSNDIPSVPDGAWVKYTVEKFYIKKY